MLELSHIHKYYNPGTVNEMCLFKDFNFEVKKGEFVSVHHSIEHNTQRININRIVVLLALNYFRCHIIRCAHSHCTAQSSLADT